MKLILTFATIIFCSHAFAQKPTKVLFPPPVLGMEYPDFTNACELLSVRINWFTHDLFIAAQTNTGPCDRKNTVSKLMPN